MHGSQCYATQLGTYDEIHAAEGQLLPHWDKLMQNLEQVGGTTLEEFRQEAEHLFRENGVTYNIYEDPRGQASPWSIDPIPLLIANDEWRQIEAGLIQRTELLNLILQDLYGEQRLIREGLLPLELVYSHTGFLRPCVGIRPPGRHHLVLASVNLARGPDGRMWIIDDRTQAPSGAGYALENRTVIKRVMFDLFREYPVQLLARYFQGLRTGLARLAPQNQGDPLIVVLTPGPYNETYFEQAYLAAYLGYPLVQGDDLTVRDNRVWLKSIEGLRMVDVIMRRLDDSFCDPLELRADSRLGVAGLLQAARRGNVAMANPIGSGILENPALFPFLPGIARFFLGEELRLPTVATWWCGQKREREFVLQNLDKLVIKPINRSFGQYSIFGATLSETQRNDLKDRITSKPHLFVGQEQVSFSTAPSLVDTQIVPRHAILRTFLVSNGKDYVAMPGGLTRIAPAEGALAVSNRLGGISKDTWVLTDAPEQYVSLWKQPRADQLIPPLGGPLPSRAADNLFWTGRYLERTELAVRLMRTVLRKLREVQKIENPGSQQCLHALMRALTHVTDSYPGFVGDEAAERLTQPQAELLELAWDKDRAGSIAASLASFNYAATSVRELWPADTWRVIDECRRDWERDADKCGSSLSRLQDSLDLLIIRLMAFSGLVAESMAREANWRMLDIGRRMERALGQIALLRGTLVPKHDETVAQQLMEAVLATSESLILFRRRYRSYLHLPTTLELLLMDKEYPRALAYQLRMLQIHVGHLPREQASRHHLQDDERTILEACNTLLLADTTRLVDPVAGQGVHQPLEDLLARIAKQLWHLSEVVTGTYFSHSQSTQLLVPKLRREEA
jgi:uncharacterized circularly permuted ATP-grasp superfamily protein/uncharacterized alpha-E superfamily protein